MKTLSNSSAPSGKPNRLRKSSWLVGSALLLLAGALHWYHISHQVDPKLVEMFETQQKPLLRKMLAAESAQERAELAATLQRSIAHLTANERRQMVEYGRWSGRDLQRDFVDRELRRARKFFTLDANEQVAALDDHIRDIETMKNVFGGLGGPGGTTPGVGEAGPGGTTPGVGDAPPDAGPEPDLRVGLKMLGSTNPEFRNVMGEYMQRLQDRRVALGLPRLPFPGM